MIAGFSFVVRWLVGLCEGGDRDTVRAFLARVEADYPHLDSVAQDAVDTGFVEMFPFRHERGHEMLEWLGPILRQQYARAPGPYLEFDQTGKAHVVAQRHQGKR